MGRSPCCDADAGVKKGPWTPEEDKKLRKHIEEHGCGSWRHLPKLAGLNRCGKSCRLRWANYLRPDIKRGRFDDKEEQLIIHLHSLLRKKLLMDGIDPVTHRPRTDLSLQNLIAAANLSNFVNNPLIKNALQLQNLQLSSDVDHGSVSAGSFMTATPVHSAPSLVAASPENCAAAPVNMSSSSSATSAPFDQAAGGGVPTLDDLLESDDLGWKDILE